MTKRLGLSVIFGLSIASIFYEGGIWIIGKIYCALICTAAIFDAMMKIKK